MSKEKHHITTGCEQTARRYDDLFRSRSKFSMSEDSNGDLWFVSGFTFNSTNDKDDPNGPSYWEIELERIK